MPDFRTLFGQHVRSTGEVYAQGTLNVRDWDNLINRPPIARLDGSNNFTLNQLMPGLVMGESTASNARVTSRAASGYDYAHRHRNPDGTRDWGWLVSAGGALRWSDITAGPLTRLEISSLGAVAIGGATPGSAAGDFTQPLDTSHRFGGITAVRATTGRALYGLHGPQNKYGLEIDTAVNPPAHGTVTDFQHSDGAAVVMRRMLTTSPGGALPAGARVCYFAQ